MDPPEDGWTPLAVLGAAATATAVVATAPLVTPAAVATGLAVGAVGAGVVAATGASDNRIFKMYVVGQKFERTYPKRLRLLIFILGDPVTRQSYTKVKKKSRVSQSFKAIINK